MHMAYTGRIAMNKADTGWIIMNMRFRKVSYSVVKKSKIVFP